MSREEMPSPSSMPPLFLSSSGDVKGSSSHSLEGDRRAVDLVQQLTVAG